MIQYHVDKTSLAYVNKKLGKLQSEGPKVYARALNKTAKDARRKLADKAQEAYTVKTAKFNKAMRLKNATAGNLVAELSATGKPLNITNYKYSAPRPGAKSQIVSSGSLKLLIMGNIKAFKGKNGLIWQRRSASRYPVKVLKSNSVPVMLGSEKRVFGIVRPNIESDLRRNIDNEIRRLIN